MASKKIQLYTDRANTIEASPETSANCVILSDGNDLQKVLDNDLTNPTVVHEETSFKVGVGDIDVSGSVVDGEVGRMVIKGQTYQNILPEPSLRNSMTNGKTMQKLNEGCDSVSTVDGVCKSAILSGNTLVNLVDYGTVNNSNNYTTIKNNDVITVTSQVSKPWLRVYYNLNITYDKKYIMMWDSLEYTQTSSNGINNLIGIWGHSDDGGQYEVKAIKQGQTNNYLIFSIPNTSPINLSKVTVRIHATTDVAEVGATTTIKGLKIMEYQDGMENWDIPYFEGMQSVKLPVLTTTGKNLFDSSTEIVTGQGINSTNGLPYNASSHSCTGFLRVKSNTTYTITQSHNRTWVFAYNKNKEYIKVVKTDILSGGNFTTPNDTYYIRLDFNTANTSEIVNGVQIEEGSVATSYEPYKTNILSTPEEVVLRSVENAQDTIDLNTGEYVQRIGEAILNGSESWQVLDNNTENTIGFTLRKVLPLRKTGDKYVKVNCDKLPSYKENLWNKDKIGCVTENNINQDLNDTQLQVRVLKSTLSTQDTNGFKSWLQTNPLTIQYILETPVVKTVDLSILDQDNQPTTQLNSFANGYIQVSSQGLIPSVDYEVPTSNSYHVDLMKPNTQYTMKNMQGTFTIDGIQYNASVNGTFTSPSTLTNKLMITNMVQTQPMLLEGDMTSKEVPYVEGIKSAFEDEDKIEVLSTGKNLFNAYKHKFDTSSSPGLRVEVLSSNSIRTYCTDTVAWRAAFVVYQLEPHTWYNIRCEVTGNGTKQLDINIPEYGTSWNPNTVNCTQSNNMLGKFLTDESGKVKLSFQGSGSESISYDNTYTNIQIEKIQEKSTVHSFYEPYKSNSTKIPLLSPLRSLPNGVCDELIIDRMKKKATLIQRVGHVILGQGDSWGAYEVVGDTMKVGRSILPDVKPNGQGMSTLIPYTFNSVAQPNEGVYVYRHSSSSEVRVRLKLKRTGRHDAIGMQNWLRGNNIITLYELETPIVTEIDLESFPLVYKDGHIFLNSEIAPVVEIDYNVNQSQQIQANNETLQRHELDILDLDNLIVSFVNAEYNLRLLKFDMELSMMALAE